MAGWSGCGDAGQVGADGLCVAPLEGCGEVLDAVMVGGGLCLWCGECGGKLVEELEYGLAKAAVGFKQYWCDGVRVVFVAFVKLAQGVGVAGCDRNVRGTRQGCCCCGGGDHYVEVHGGVGSVEGDV